MTEREKMARAAVWCVGGGPVLLGAFALLLASCDNRDGLAATHVVPMQVAPDEFTVRVIWHPHLDSVRAVSASMGESMDIKGLSIMTTNPGGRRGYDCEIHVVYPDDLRLETQELLGHEFAHCLFGRYHK